MTAKCTAVSRNRKLPPDTVIRAAYYGEGLTIRQIARRHGVDENIIHNLFSRRGWTRRERPSAATAPELCPTATKVITTRFGFSHSRSTVFTEYLISLPRVPTLDGVFAGA